MTRTSHLRSAGPLVGICALLTCAHPQEPKLFPGKRAPVLQVERWYKGTPIDKLAANKTYVIEFWATWCGPCREAIPHLTELAHKYAGKVTFIGVDVMEDPDLAPAFVKQMGASMDYHVGYGGKYEGMFSGWAKPALQTGIPISYIVHDGIVYWIGSPEDLVKPLQQVVAGQFDLSASRNSYFAEVMVDGNERQVQLDLYTAEEVYRAGNLKEALAKVNAIQKRFPGSAFETSMAKLRWWSSSDRKKAALELEHMSHLPMNDRSFELLIGFARMENQRTANDSTLSGRALQIVAEMGKQNWGAQLGLVSYLRETSADPRDIVDGINRTLPLLNASTFKQKDQAVKLLNSWKGEAEARLGEKGQ